MNVQGNVKKSDHTKYDKPAMYFVGADRKSYTKEVPDGYDIDSHSEYVAGNYVLKEPDQNVSVVTEQNKSNENLIKDIIFIGIIILIFVVFFCTK